MLNVWYLFIFIPHESPISWMLGYLKISTNYWLIDSISFQSLKLMCFPIWMDKIFAFPILMDKSSISKDRFPMVPRSLQVVAQTGDANQLTPKLALLALALASCWWARERMSLFFKTLDLSCLVWFQCCESVWWIGFDWSYILCWVDGSKMCPNTKKTPHPGGHLWQLGAQVTNCFGQVETTIC